MCPVKILVGNGRLGPMAVFLPDGSHAEVPAHENLIAPLAAQVQARGTEASWEQHARRLVAGPSYAGQWSLLEVSEGISATQALHYARYRAAASFLR